MKARGSAPLLLNLKEPNCDGDLNRRACQLQLLVMRQRRDLGWAVGPVLQLYHHIHRATASNNPSPNNDPKMTLLYRASHTGK